MGLRLEARLWGNIVDSDSALFCSSGVNGGLCAIAADSDMLWQTELLGGVVFRF